MTLLPSLAGGPHSRTRRWLALVAALTGLLLTLSSCAPGSNGVEKESGREIIQAAGAALRSAHSFEIHATSTVAASPASITFEIEGPHSGGGSFTSAAVAFEAEELGGVDYFRSKTLWSQVGGASLQADLGDRWVFIAASSATAAQLTLAFGELTSAANLANALTKTDTTAVRGKSDAVTGQPAVAVRESPTNTIYVATTGKPYPLRWVQSTAGVVTFSHFGKHFHLKAPRKPLNLAALLGR
ncbi:MAG TPA: hypothetical protein VNH82_00685 [Candidatus Dormibacteraeota bacterium]|nr:hypothetical protein [Candidatus Dormibacteraeota bacterium]